MKRKAPSLQKSLPRYYFLVIFVTFTAMLTAFYIYYTKNLRASEYLNLQNVCDSACSNMEQEIEKMSTVSLNTIYSKDILPGIRGIHVDQLGTQQTYTQVQAIYNSISAMIGPQQTVAQINLYHKNGFSVGTGFYTYNKKINLEEKSWYSDVLAENGYKIMSTPQPISHFIPTAAISYEPYYISLTRLYFDDVHQMEGAVEVLQKCDTFFSFIDRLTAANPSLSLLIMDRNGELIYPVDERGEETAHLTAVLAEKQDIPAGRTVHVRDENGRKNALHRQTVKTVGWQIYVFEPNSVITRSLATPTFLFLAVLVAGLLLTMAVCFSISRRILQPVGELTETFETLVLDDVFSHTIDTVSLPQSHYEEIQTLITSFRDMYNKMNASTMEMLKSQENEIRAKEIATQSMMKPHFLYNNLANISVMAEENMNQEIITLTENLCDYLRYTSTGSEIRVPVSDEFLYTQKYLACMNVRYRGRLTCDFTLDERMGEIQIPKLSLQPIIENSLKYAFMKKPPWHITVRGYLDVAAGKWLIRITDNGVGFTGEELRKLTHTLESIRDSKDITRLKIGGMGLQNVYLRLLLQYGPSAILTVENDPEGGACITMGGSIANVRNS